jgi:hypothetical protein
MGRAIKNPRERIIRCLCKWRGPLSKTRLHMGFSFCPRCERLIDEPLPTWAARPKRIQELRAIQ